MSTATTTDTGQTNSHRTTQPPTTPPATQTERPAANRLRSTMAAVRLAFTWLGTRKTLAPEQRDTAAWELHADRELISATNLLLDTTAECPQPPPHRTPPDNAHSSAP
jgi:hypothetical protein